MRQIKIVKKMLHINDIDLQHSIKDDSYQGIETYEPAGGGGDGMCYSVTNDDRFGKYGRPKGSVVSMWNRRGGKPNGTVYSFSHNAIWDYSSVQDINYTELYGADTTAKIKKMPFYNQISTIVNGIPSRKIKLTLDLNNPENIIIWWEQNYIKNLDKTPRYDVSHVIPDGRFLFLDGDQSLNKLGHFKEGLKKGIWISKHCREDNINKLTELIFKSDGKVVSSLLRGCNLTNETYSTKYFREDGSLYANYRKKIVGKLHDGIASNL